MPDETNRDVVAMKLGFSSFEQYLQSDLWSHIRKRFLAYSQDKGRVDERSASRCFVCKSIDNIVVFFADYSVQVLVGNRFDLMVPLCVRCHSAVEFKRGVKCGLDESKDRLQAIANLINQDRRFDENAIEKEIESYKRLFTEFP